MGVWLQFMLDSILVAGLENNPVQVFRKTDNGAYQARP
jgi:hypothetical protein